MDVFRPPPSHQPIWHYTDFTNLVAIFEGQGIYFSRADLLDDKFEGSVSKPHKQYMISGEKVDADAYAERLKQVRASSYVHCWHMNEHESAAMWKLYSSSTTDAIAIQTTAGRLRESLPEEVLIGQVRYISYEDDEIPFGDLRWPLMHKAKSFEHERELRALRADIANANRNHYPEQWKAGEMALDDLIERIHISPWAKRWLFELVKKVVRRYGLNIPVTQSELQREPLF
jgi:hypothetical protein